MYAIRSYYVFLAQNAHFADLEICMRNEGGIMRFWKSWGISAALLVALIPMTVQAASLSGRSSTVLEWFDNANEDTAIGAYQFV